jgi:hypothetical protein
MTTRRVMGIDIVITERLLSRVFVIATLALISAMALSHDFAAFIALTVAPVVSVFALAVLIVGVYFIPLIVAIYRHHRNKLAIGILNILLGWTIVGWIAALVWACTADVDSEG